MLVSQEKEWDDYQRPIWKRYWDNLKTSLSLALENAYPLTPQNCSPFSTYLIAPGNLWLFRARYALPRFRKGLRRACLECCRPHPWTATRKTKNHPSVANIYPWYFVRKFLESNCTVATSNERYWGMCTEYFTSCVFQWVCLLSHSKCVLIILIWFQYYITVLI